jgi:hypothetical protein
LTVTVVVVTGASKFANSDGDIVQTLLVKSLELHVRLHVEQINSSPRWVIEAISLEQIHPAGIPCSFVGSDVFLTSFSIICYSAFTYDLISPATTPIANPEVAGIPKTLKIC